MPPGSAAVSIAVPGPLAEVGQPTGESIILWTVALATMLAPLNSTMIAVALPHLVADLGVDLAAAGWLVTGYLILMALLQPLAGKLGDRFGRGRLLCGGLAVFGLAALGAALAADLATLIPWRLLGAAAGAVITPNGTALVRQVVPEARRGRAFGLIGAAAGLAAALGPPLGGLVDGAVGWRAIFWLNLPLVAPALVLAWRQVRPVASAQETGSASRAAPFDLPGAALLGLTIALGAGTLMQIGRAEPAPLVAAGVAVAVLAVMLTRWEARQPDPVLRLRLFRARGFAAASAAIALSNLAMYTTLLAVPQLLTRRWGWGSAEAGLALAALSVGMVVFAPLGGRLADRLGRRAPTGAGLAILTVALLPPMLVGAGIAPWPLLIGLGAAGLGLGLANAGIQAAAVDAVDVREAGIAAGLLSTCRYLGSIVGSGLLATLLGRGAGPVDGFTAVFAMAALCAGLSTAAALVLPGRAAPPEAGRQPTMLPR